MAWYETGIRSLVIRWICPAPPCACCSADTFCCCCCCCSGCCCCCCCCGLENRKREDDMVADPDAALSLSVPAPRPTPKHFRLLPPTQQSKTLKNLFSHVSTKKYSLIYWIRGGRFVCSFRNPWQHLRNQWPFFQTQLKNAGESRGLRCLSRASQRNPKPRRWKP